MHTAMPSEKDITDEITALQAREWLLLLNEPLAPGECLRRAQALSITQRDTTSLLSALDHPVIDTAILQKYSDKYTDYRRYIKGSLLDTFRSVQALEFRWAYCAQIKTDATIFVDLIREAGNNTDKARQLAEKAIYVRNSTRDKFLSASARKASELKKVPWEFVKKAGKDFLNAPTQDKHHIDYLIRHVNKGGAAFKDLGKDKQIEVLVQVAEGSGRAGGWSGTKKVLSSSVGPLMATVDLILVTNDAFNARDPYRTVTSYGLRLGTAAVVSMATEAVALAVVSALAMSTGVGAAFMLIAPMLANSFINEWVNSSVMAVYDEFNPRISAVLRDVSWEPADLKFSLEEEVPMLSMTSDFTMSMIEGG